MKQVKPWNRKKAFCPPPTLSVRFKLSLALKLYSNIDYSDDNFYQLLNIEHQPPLRGDLNKVVLSVVRLTLGWVNFFYFFNMVFNGMGDTKKDKLWKQQ